MKQKKVLFERAVTLNRTWKIVFLLDPDHDKFEADWNDDGTPIWGYYWLHVQVWNMNGDDWEQDFAGSIKWDGCSNWNMTDACWHLCGPDDAKLFSIIYEDARRLLRSDYLDQKFERGK